MLDKIDIKVLNKIAIDAGAAIMKIYSQPFEVEQKSDDSPLTLADRESNRIILEGLQKYYPEIPYISEETKQISYDERKDWEYFWLIDPLDGTKEFIKKNDEFTVNIALIHNGVPELGVVYLPAKEILYYAMKGQGSFKIDKNSQPQKINARKLKDKKELIIMGSRSHGNQELQDFVEQKKHEYENVEFIASGSSLKFTMIAEGKADIYPRLGPTMEWDTGAAHAIVLECGKKVYKYGTDEQLTYNKENLLNPWFIVE
jgi:3'(2'), 5'-bisphosphate nucleotidase